MKYCNLNYLIFLFKRIVGQAQICKICKYQNLSENFIREFKDKVDWGGLSIKQNLSENFIYEFGDKLDKLDIERLIERKLITKNRLKGLKQEEINWRKKVKKRSYRFELMEI